MATYLSLFFVYFWEAIKNLFMRLQEINRGSDFGCVLSLTDSSPFFQYLNKYNVFAPIIMRRDQGAITLTALIDKISASSKFRNSFLQAYNAEERGNSWYVKIPNSFSSLFSILDELVEVPSAVMQNLYLESEQLFVVLKFHQSVANHISNVLMKSTRGAEKITIESFVCPSGTSTFLNTLHSKIPLCFVKYSVKAFLEDPLEKYLSAGDNIGELEKKPGTNYRALIHSSAPLSEQGDIITIDREENIYETWGNNPIIQKIRSMSNDRVIYRAAHFARVIRDRLEMSVFLPASQAMDFLEILSGIMDDHGSRSVTLLYFEAFNPGVMDLV
jgi:hypothetical protein